MKDIQIEESNWGRDEIKATATVTIKESEILQAMVNALAPSISKYIFDRSITINKEIEGRIVKSVVDEFYTKRYDANYHDDTMKGELMKRLVETISSRITDEEFKKMFMQYLINRK